MSAGGHCANRLCHGQLHGGWCVRARHVGRDGNRQESRHHFLGGAAVGEGGHGEVISAEELGGADTHGRRSGVVDHVAENDAHALLIVRDIVSRLGSRAQSGVELRPTRPPKFDPSGLYDVIPSDVRAPYDVREVIKRLVDDSELHEFKALYGTTLCVRLRAYLGAFPVAILANNGVLFSESALKGTHFIELACQRRIPLLFLQNISGFMVGGKYEAGGIAKTAAKLVTAVATASVPKITVLIGGSFGAGNYGMAGRAYSLAFSVYLAEQPHQRHGGEQAAAVLATIKRDAMERARNIGRWRRKLLLRRRSARVTRRRAIPTTPRPDSGTTASSIRRKPAMCWVWRSRPP